MNVRSIGCSPRALVEKVEGLKSILGEFPSQAKVKIRDNGSIVSVKVTGRSLRARLLSLIGMGARKMQFLKQEDPAVVYNKIVEACRKFDKKA